MHVLVCVGVTDFPILYTPIQLSCWFQALLVLSPAVTLTAGLFCAEMRQNQNKWFSAGRFELETSGRSYTPQLYNASQQLLPFHSYLLWNKSQLGRSDKQKQHLSGQYHWPHIKNSWNWLRNNPLSACSARRRSPRYKLT